MNNPIQILPCFSLEPNKLVLFNRVFRSSNYNADGTIKDKVKRINPAKYEQQTPSDGVKRSSHNLELSANAYRSLRKKINWLYYLSKARHRKTYNGKDIYNFKMCFLTLQLASKQKHSSVEITKNMFNQFLTEIRQRTGMENYVWRLEYQKNGNVHYHLCTDSYLDYYFVLPIWNRIQKNYGYIESYTAKHLDMSLLDYNKAYNADKSKPFDIMAKRYAKGCKNAWTQPNSIDCKSVVSKKAIASYISKYFGKNGSAGIASNGFDTPENTANMRLWFCSRSLSKLGSISDFCEAFEVDVRAIVESAKNIRTYFAQYATIIYFEMKEMPTYCRQILEPILRKHATAGGYSPSLY